MSGRGASATGAVVRAEYLNDGISRPEWDYGKATVSVDRTYLLDAAHDEIRDGTMVADEGGARTSTTASSSPR
jgi:hypothetical protein